MSSGVLGVALAGLNAAQAGLLTTGNNLVNVNTPGYSRQEIVQEGTSATYTGGGFLGTGVNVVDVKRIYADDLQAQAFSLQAQSAQYGAYNDQISSLDNLVSDTNLNVNTSVNAFFASVQNLSASPSDSSARQAMLSSAQTMATNFRTFDSHLEDIRSGVTAQMQTSVSTINNLAKQVASLNNAIVQATGTGHPPNDLLDKRDQLITEINKEIQVTAVPQKEGNVNLFLANGQSIVMGGNSQQLAVTSSDLDAQKKSIGLVTGTGIRAFRDDEIVSGTLGGVVAFRDQVLDPTQNAIGRLALAVGSQVNAQLSLGQDQNGAPGTALFTLAPPRVLSAAHNVGNAVLGVSVSDYSALTTSDYRVNYDGTNYVVTRLSDNAQTSYATLPQTLDGMTISIGSGAAAAGDAFLVEPARQGAAGLNVTALTTSQIATAAPIRTGSAFANTGNAQVSTGSVLASDPNLTQPVTITFTGPGTYSVSGTGTGNPVGLAYVSGGNISYNGWSLAISGTPNAGDVFTVGPNTAGTADNRNALMLASLAQTGSVGGGTYSNAYASVLSTVGSKAQEVAAASKSQDGILAQVQQSIASVSGVNLDEEAANLMRYQQAYQAASKVIAIADQMFQSLIQASV